MDGEDEIMYDGGYSRGPVKIEEAKPAITELIQTFLFFFKKKTYYLEAWLYSRNNLIPVDKVTTLDMIAYHFKIQSSDLLIGVRKYNGMIINNEPAFKSQKDALKFVEEFIEPHLLMNKLAG
jgi:hypothetical protein